MKFTKGPLISEEIFENEFLKLQLKVFKMFGVIQSSNENYKSLRHLLGLTVVLQLFGMGSFKCYLLITKFKGFTELGMAECSIFLYMIDIFIIIHIIRNITGYKYLIIKLWKTLLKFKSGKLSPEIEIYNDCVYNIKYITKRLILPTTFTMLFIAFHSLYYLIFDEKNYSKAFINEVYPIMEYFSNLPLLWAIQILSMITSILLLLIWQTFVAGLLTFPIFLLRLLNYRWGNFKIKKENSEFGIFKFLKNQIDDHNFIISTIREVENLMASFVVAEFIIFSMVLCFLMYQLALGKSPDFVLVVIFYTQAVLRILYVYYQQGQLIYDLTDNASLAIYSVNWYDLNKRGQQLFLIALRATAIPIQMVAYTLRLNRPTFLEILKTSYSYFNLLTTMSE